MAYFTPTGYRRIPLNTCSGGLELEYSSKELPCPNHEEEFARQHRGLSGFVFFLVAIVLPLGAAGAIGCYVYTNWDGKLGPIRLGEAGLGSRADIFDAERLWIKYPVALLSAFVAVVAASPMLLASTWRSVSAMFGRPTPRFTTRQSFSRGRGQYTVVDEDEDELLGDEEDEET
jgi:hypothetical protein